MARGSPETQKHWLVYMAPEPGLAHVDISQKGFLEAMIADPPWPRSHGLRCDGLRLDGETPSSRLFGTNAASDHHPS